jgi:LPXTG-site transpeptidase (sortase) family protein
MQVKSWSELTRVILSRKIPFLAAFFVVFTISYAFLFWIDFLPELVDPKNRLDQTEEVMDNLDANTEVLEESLEVVPEIEIKEPSFPTSMYIAALDRNIDILNPASRSVEDLDKALLDGTVRHPDSATLERNGTVFILGHSSYLPVVNNKNFQAFNGIQKLKWGELIEVTSAEGKYIYRVEKVYRAKAQNVTVPIAGEDRRLVLATCNSFGTTDDRYIVEAKLIEEKLY